MKSSRISFGGRGPDGIFVGEKKGGDGFRRLFRALIRTEEAVPQPEDRAELADENHGDLGDKERRATGGGLLHCGFPWTVRLLEG